MEEIQSYTPSQDNEGTIPSYPDMYATKQIAPDIASDRAKRADYGLLGKVKETYPELFQDISDGKEQELRDNVASQIAYNNITKRAQIVAGVASKLDRPITSDDLTEIDRRLTEPSYAPTVFENHFAKSYLENMNWVLKDPDTSGWAKQAIQQWPSEMDAYRNIGERLVSSNDLLRNRLQDVSSKIDDQSFLSKIWDVGRTSIPFYQDARLRGLVDGVGFHLGLGDNLQDQSLKFFAMSDKEQVAVLDSIEKTIGDNPHLHAAYLSALLGQSTEERIFNNMTTALDALTASGAIKAVSKIAFPQLDAKSYVNGIVKSVADRPFPPDITGPASAGDLETAALRRIVNETLGDLANNDPRHNYFEGLQNFFKNNIDSFYTNPGNYGSELLNQLKEKTLLSRDLLITKLINAMRNENIPFMRAMDNNYKEAIEWLKGYMPGLKVIDIGYPVKTEMGNWQVEYRIGNANSALFNEPEHAHGFARLNNITDYTVGPASGSGYYIRIFRPWNETDQFTRNEISKAVETNAYGSKTPDSTFHSFLGGLLAPLRSPEETMSLYARTQRGIATFGSNIIHTIADKIGEDFIKLSKGTYPFSNKRAKWNDFKRILQEGQKTIDPETGIPGYTFKNPSELEYAYRRLLQRSPDEQEIKAYFSWKELNELDWNLRNLSVYRNKARSGAVQISIRTKDKNGLKINSDYVDAIPVNKIPTGIGKVLIMGNSFDEARILTTKALASNTEMGTILRTGKTKAGHFTSKPQVYQLYDELERPFKGWGPVKDDKIRYVVGNFDVKNLNFQQLPRTGGGHFIYEYPYYLKQAILSSEDGKTTYEGDKTVLAIRNRAEGRLIEKAMNGFRELIKDNKLIEAQEFLRNNSFGYDYKDVYKMFKPVSQRDSLGRIRSSRPILDINEPVRLMDNNTTIGDAFANEYTNKFGKNYINSLKSGNPASQYKLAFTGERDARELMTVLDVGSKGNPVFKREAAQLVDPISALNRGIAGIANSFFFDDLKIGFMEHWLQEAKPYLRLKPNELQNRAFSVFHDPDWIKNPNSDQLERIKQLQVVRSQHLQLVQRPSQQESILMTIAQKLSDSIYKNAGPKFVISPLSIYAMAKDGPTFLRGIASHFKLGMFNPNQLIKQMNTWAVIYGIEGPTRASQGAVAAHMYHLSGLNRTSSVLDSMGKITEKFGWRPGEFKEFADLIDNSGFGTVGGEHAYKDDIWSGNVYKSGANKFLSLGMSFFTEGERNIRYGAMATAYRRFRDANPTGALSAANKEEILQRARLLNVNMDRAANSLWQNGLSSIPLQFQTYALRTAELMWGKRLTRIEKARLFATYSTLYGLPIAATLGGFPIADHLRQLAYDNKYNVGEDYIKNTLMEGLPAVIGNMITGHTYNVGQAYGSSGVGNYLFDLHSDATMWDIILSTATGPSGGVLADTWANTDPIRRWGIDIFNDTAHINWEDVIKAFKAISPIRTADQTRIAFKTGNWYTRKGTLLDTDIQPMDALWMFMSGLEHQDISDAFIKNNTIQDQKRDNEQTEKLFIERWHKGIASAQAGPGYNPDQARKYFEQSRDILKMRAYPLSDYPSLYAKAMEGQETLVDSISRDFGMKHIPAGKEDSRIQQYRQEMNIRNR